MLRQKTRKTSKKQCEILYKCKRWSELRQKDDTKVHFNLCAEISTNRWAMQSKLKRIWLKCLQRGCKGGEKRGPKDVPAALRGMCDCKWSQCRVHSEIQQIRFLILFIRIIC